MWKTLLVINKKQIPKRGAHFEDRAWCGVIWFLIWRLIHFVIEHSNLISNWNPLCHLTDGTFYRIHQQDVDYKSIHSFTHSLRQSFLVHSYILFEFLRYTWHSKLSTFVEHHMQPTRTENPTRSSTTASTLDKSKPYKEDTHAAQYKEQNPDPEWMNAQQKALSLPMLITLEEHSVSVFGRSWTLGRFPDDARVWMVWARLQGAS